MVQTVTQEYLDGIRDARATLRKIQSGQDSCYSAAELPEFMRDELAGIERTIKGFAASTPVGQMLRGERDFWRNQIKRSAAA